MKKILSALLLASAMLVSQPAFGMEVIEVADGEISFQDARMQELAARIATTQNPRESQLFQEELKLRLQGKHTRANITRFTNWAQLHPGQAITTGLVTALIIGGTIYWVYRNPDGALAKVVKSPWTLTKNISSWVWNCRPVSALKTSISDSVRGTWNLIFGSGASTVSKAAAGSAPSTVSAAAPHIADTVTSSAPSTVSAAAPHIADTVTSSAPSAISAAAPHIADTVTSSAPSAISAAAPHIADTVTSSAPSAISAAAPHIADTVTISVPRTASVASLHIVEPAGYIAGRTKLLLQLIRTYKPNKTEPVAQFIQRALKEAQEIVTYAQQHNIVAPEAQQFLSELTWAEKSFWSKAWTAFTGLFSHRSTTHVSTARFAASATCS